MFSSLKRPNGCSAMIAALLAALSLFSAPRPASAQTTSYEQVRAAIVQGREVAANTDRQRAPVAWAVAQTDLARQLFELSIHQVREDSASAFLASLDESATLYRAALEVLTPETTPTEWLAAQNGLGDTLLFAGAMRTGASAVGMLVSADIDPGFDSRDAAVAFRAVLSVQTREVDPIAWERVQTKLGSALATWLTRQRLREPDAAETNAIQDEAERAFRDALSAISLRENPEDWAAANEGLTNLYEMAASSIGQEDVEDEAALERSEARRVQYIRAAMTASSEAERAYRILGDEESARYSSERLERLREDSSPRRIAPN